MSLSTDMVDLCSPLISVVIYLGLYTVELCIMVMVELCINLNRMIIQQNASWPVIV